MAIRTVVLPVAGMGTRFLPLTKAVPKEMLPIVDRPIIAYIAGEAVASGVDRVVLVTARGKGAIEDYFDRSPELERHLESQGKLDLLAAVREAGRMAEVVSVRQREILGLGHAVLCARAAVGDQDPFAVMLGDEVMSTDPPALQRLIDVHHQTGGSVIGLVPVPTDQTHRYGICAGPETGPGRLRVDTMVEKPRAGTSPGNLAIIGRYICTPDIWPDLAATKPGAGGEIQFTDALAKQAALGRMTGIVLTNTRFDTGNPLGLLQAALHFSHGRPELRAGVRALAREVLALPEDA